MTDEEKAERAKGIIKELLIDARPEQVDHPQHYGGEGDTYEAIKVIEAWSLGFHLGNVLKYLSRAGKKNSKLEDLRKAQWYLNRYIELEEK